ncbi:hypothetical protein HMPREF1326_01917 [Akkermansia sp. KLE1605]|nr:hypothetical protein HMPREF1326_01917 [Akkermansia sp. KLE1605]
MIFGNKEGREFFPLLLQPGLYIFHPLHLSPDGAGVIFRTI